jgi:uncharacterized protein (TIGR03437 family)
MKQAFASLAVALSICAGAPAATINTTLTLTVTGALSGTGIAATGTANLTNIGSGPFTSTISLTAVSGTSVSAPFTITLAGGTLTGTILVPVALVSGAATGTGSATITGGTGTYAGATGSFPSLAATSSGSIVSNLTLSFSGAGTVTTGGGGPVGPAAPTITAVLDAGSYTANIAQGSIFVVKGSEMSASGYNPFGFPLPTSSGGVRITFTPASGGSGTDAYLVYTYNLSGVNQLAGLLPSTVPTGSYRVTVTNNSGAVSAPFTAQVVQRKLGLITQDSSGSGLAAVQNYISASQLDLDRFTTGTIPGTAITISPARPGQVLIAWATGMGPVSGGDNTASPGFNFAANGVNVQVIVGGMSITPAYAGRAPYLAGADQINFTLPANVPTGCTVPFQVSVNGALSNPTFIAIAPDASANACALAGYTTAQLQNFDQGGTYTAGGFSLTQLSLTDPQSGTVKFNTAGGSFTRYSGFQLAALAARSQSSSDACQVFHVVGSQDQLTVIGGGTNLDAGAITLNGPSGSNISNQALKQDAENNNYSLTLGTDGLPSGIPGLGGTGTIVAGTYTLAGAGGTGVGRFNASITLGSPLTITGGLPSTVTRSAGLPLNWTGGNATDVVQIFGYSGATTGSGASATVDAWEFSCTTTAGKGGFTVPSSVLLQLPAVSASAISSGAGAAFLQVLSSVNPSAGNGLFSAPLTAGGSIDSGIFSAMVGIGATPAYQ